MLTFGSFVKKLRISKKKTLVVFCKEVGFDVKLWSNIERGIGQPPRSSAILDAIATNLGLDKTTVKYKTFIFLAFCGDWRDYVACQGYVKLPFGFVFRCGFVKIN